MMMHLHKVCELGYVWEMLAPMILLHWGIAGWQLWWSKEIAIGDSEVLEMQIVGSFRAKSSVVGLPVCLAVCGSVCLSNLFVCLLSVCIGWLEGELVSGARSGYVWEIPPLTMRLTLVHDDKSIEYEAWCLLLPYAGYRLGTVVQLNLDYLWQTIPYWHHSRWWLTAGMIPTWA